MSKDLWYYYMHLKYILIWWEVLYSLEVVTGMRKVENSMAECEYSAELLAVIGNILDITNCQGFLNIFYEHLSFILTSVNLS